MKKRINKERKKENPDKAKIAKLNTELNFANMELEMLTQATNDQIEQAAEEERLRNEDNAEEEARKKAEREVVSTFNSVWGDRYDNNFQNEARDLLKRYAHVPGVVDALADPQAKNERTEDEVAAGVLGSIRISMGNTNAQGEADKGGINTGVLSNTSGNTSDWKDLTRFGKFFTNEPVGKEKGIVSWGKACDLVEQSCRDENVEVKMGGNDALMTMLSQAAQFGEAQGQTAAAGISNYILAKRIEQAREAARQWDSDNEQYREQNTLYSVGQNEEGEVRFSIAIDKELRNKYPDLPVLTKEQEEVYRITDKEINEMRERMKSWLTKDKLDRAKNMTRKERKDEFGNDVLPIAFVPSAIMPLLGSNIKSNKVYSAEWYVIDHAIVNHPSLNIDDYDLIQKVLNLPKHIRYTYNTETGKPSFVFTAMFPTSKGNRWNAVTIQVETDNDGNLIWYKNYYNQKKEPNKSSTDLLDSYKKPEEVGDLPSLQGDSSIIRTEAHGRSLSARSGISDGKGTTNSRTNQTNSEKNSGNLQGGEDMRFSVTPEQDAEYMRAVESGDTEKAGQMVKAAFKAKYPESVYGTTEFLHGNKNKFTEFKDTQKNDAGWLGKGFYFFGNNPVYASQYGENIYKSFLNIENPYYISNEEYNNLAEKNNNEYSREFTERIREEGYDAVVREPDLDFEVVVFEPNQIKSADPITYDDEGNVMYQEIT
ncbi:MAG: hypothetical protein MJ002_03720 [Paludibacteraceae bacterium]|nr:hypothetical protein [Paludibacteraceae bacterium]